MPRHPEVLLVSLYELGHQPFSTALAAGFLEREGVAVSCLDLAVESPDWERLRRAEIVVFFVPMHTALRLAVRLAARLQEVNAACVTVYCGHYAALNADMLSSLGAHRVLGGEYERELVAVIRSVQAGAAPAKRAARIDRGASPIILEKLDFAAPARHGLPPLDSYARLERDGVRRLAGHVEATRGCRHHCTHCPLPAIYGGRVFALPVDLVVADIERQVAAGAEHVSFGDPDFLNAKSHSLRIAREIHRRYPELTFDFTAKIEHLLRHEAAVAELAALGAIFVVSAVESLSERVLEILRKGHTSADVWLAAGRLRDLGLHLRPTFVPFTPWSTLDDYVDMLEFVATQRLIDSVEPVQYAIRLLVPPGSLLEESGDFLPHRTELDRHALTWRWRHGDPRMDDLFDRVSGIVAEATARQAETQETFEAVRHAAQALAGRSWAGPGGALKSEARRAPRLTEAWFC